MASLLVTPSARVDLAKDPIKDLKLFDAAHADPRVGVITLINAADFYVAGGHFGLKDVCIALDVGVDKIRLRGQRFNPVTPEGGVDHLATLKNLVAGKRDEVLIEVAMISGVQPHAVRPGHHVVFDHAHDIGMPHPVAHTEPGHTEDL